MGTYIQKSDKRDTGNGMTPNKAIKRPSNPAPKKPMGVPKKMIRRPQGK